MQEKVWKDFPVGFYEFHEVAAFNFQLNRFYSQGVFSKEELFAIAKEIDGFEKWISLFRRLGEESEAGQEYLRAATCYRAAQFYTLSDEKDEKGNNLKVILYEKCRKMYDAYLSRCPSIKYVQIPFQNYKLPVYHALCENAKGDIVIHGGYDSIAQEFLVFLPYFQEMGYNVYLFEGPGQGEVLMRYDVRMTPEWEGCTSAVLDYFHLKDVTLIGISLGGYLAPRAAAYEKRISRVVMYDLIYDFYGAVLAKMGKKAKLFDYLTKHPKNLLWKSVNRKLDQNYFTNWLLKQGYAIYENIHTPCEYFNYIRKFNTRDLSKLLTQDILVLAGASDLYTIYYEEQLKALTNARSVTGRLFTREENADHHCQVGNMGLLLKVMTDWIEEKSGGKETCADGRQA